LSRLKKLKEKFNFECDCIFCHEPHQKFQSDWDRETYTGFAHGKFELSIQNVVTTFDQSVRKTLAQSYIPLLVNGLVKLRKEGIEAGNSGAYYSYLMFLYGILGERKKMREWGIKAIMMYPSMSERRVTAEDVASWVNWLRDPKDSFPYWPKA